MGTSDHEEAASLYESEGSTAIIESSNTGSI